MFPVIKTLISTQEKKEEKLQSERRRCPICKCFLVYVGSTQLYYCVDDCAYFDYKNED